MTNAFERRAQRVLATTDGLLADSKLVIWTYLPSEMPAMIDLLIAQRRLTEADRPRCIHWQTLKGDEALSDAGISKVVDADDMLVAAGIRTMLSEPFDIFEQQGLEPLLTFVRDRYGELAPEEIAQLRELEPKMRPLPPAHA